MIISLIAALAVTRQAPTLPAGPPVPSKVVLTVNGHAFTAKEVEAYLWDWSAAEVGQALTVLELIREEAAKNSVTVTAEEIKTRVDSEVLQISSQAAHRIPGRPSPPPAMPPRSKMELGVRAQLLLQKLAEKSFRPADFVKVATIVIHPKTESSDDLKAALAKADEAYAALMKGDTWDKVLPIYATDAKFVQNNGDLGWVKLADFPAPTKTEIDSLALNGYTKPVQTPNGIQIFKIEARAKDAAAGEMEKTKQQYLQSAERDIIMRLEKDAKIVKAY